MDNNIHDMLVEAQTVAYNAHTDQIVELAQSYENNDDVIKKLIDERRMVYNEFAKRIATVEAAKN
jgi:predicted transcriptional regulator